MANELTKIILIEKKPTPLSKCFFVECYSFFSWFFTPSNAPKSPLDIIFCCAVGLKGMIQPTNNYPCVIQRQIIFSFLASFYHLFNGIHQDFVWQRGSSEDQPCIPIELNRTRLSIIFKKCLTMRLSLVKRSSIITSNIATN